MATVTVSWLEHKFYHYATGHAIVLAKSLKIYFTTYPRVYCS